MLRRDLLTGIGAAASLALLTSNRAQASTNCNVAKATQNRDVLIQIFLRGGADALNMCVPHADQGYAQLRREAGVFDVMIDNPLSVGDGYFGLHPKFAPLIDNGCWANGDLAIVMGAGDAGGRRSHFANEDRIEYANGQEKATDGGWMARYLRAASPVVVDPFARALALQPSAPSALFGSTSVVTTRRLNDLELNVDDPEAYAQAIRSLHEGADSPVEILGARTAEVVNDVACKDLAGVSHNGVRYPDSVLGDQLSEAAKVIKAVPEVELICLDYGGWDTHGDQLARQDALIGNLAESLAALYADLGAESGRANIANVTVMVQSEFGRRLRGNGSQGTDHGTGGLMMLLGGGVRGGIHAQNWSRSDGSLLGEMAHRGDLRVTTDYRSVLTQLLERRLGLDLGAADWETMFPRFGYQPSTLDLFEYRA